MKIGSLIPGSDLPLLITPNRDTDRDPERLMAWLATAGDELSPLLLQSGGILFRGFDITDPATLDPIIRTISPQPINYIGGNSPRTRITNKVYTSTEYPPEHAITLHNELSYAPAWPTRILFYCHTPSSEGGETPIADTRLILSRLPAELVERFQEKGLIYLQTLHGGAGLGRSWQATFETADRSKVEDYLEEGNVQFAWSETGELKIRYHRNAIEKHPLTHEFLWFNQADQWHPSSLGDDVRSMMEQILKAEDFPHNVVFGDGSPINDGDVEAIRNVSWDCSIAYPWQRGDLLLLDNMLVAHGRKPFKGVRKVYVAMA